MFAGAAFTDSADIKVDTEVVDTLVSLGVVNGYDDGSFKPNGTVTRAEMAKMIYVLRTGNSDASAYNDDKTSFTDIGSHWARGYIKYCQSLGIIAGKSNTKFCPNDKVTAQEAAKMLLVTLGYNATKAGLTGANWASKTNALADENGLLEDVNTSFTSACPRQYAAQLIYNAIDAPTVVLRDGEYTNKTLMGNEDLQTVGEKYMGLNTAKGVVTAVDHNNKGYTMTVTTAYKANPFTDAAADKKEVTLTSIDFDPTNFVGSYVKAMYKKTDKVYGVSVDSKQTCASVVTDLGDIDLNKDEYKLNGVTFKTKAADFGAIKVVDTLGAQLDKDATNKAADLDDVAATADKYAVSKASDVALIDYDGDEKIDVAVVTPVVFGKLTYFGSSKLTVNGGVLSNVSKDDCVLYDGAAKDDFVAVVKDTYVADDKNVITKLDKTSGKVEAKKDTDKFRVDGTWYTKLVGGTYEVGTTDGDYYIYNGYIVMDDAKSGSIADTAYVIKVGSAFDVDGNNQVKVMVNGETKVVSADLSKSDIVAGDKDVLCKYEIDDGVYEFTKITSTATAPSGFTYGTVASYKDKKLYSDASASSTSYILDSNAVVYVKYKDDKYSILTGKDVAGWGDKLKTLTGVVLTKKKDGMTVVKGAALNLGNKAIPASTATYGVITSDIVSAKDNKAEFTIWNGTEYIDVVTKSTVSALHKFDLVEYQANTDNTYDITLKKAASTKKAIVGYSKTSGDIKFADATNASGRVSKIVTDDTQVIFVNTDKDVDAKDAGIIGEEIAVSDEPVSGTYNTNVIWYDDDDSDTDLTVLVIDTVNTEYAAS